MGERYVRPSAVPIAEYVRAEDVPPWHAYDGCYGCRKAGAINRQLAKQRES